MLKGISADVIKAIMAKLGLNKTINVYPWARGYHHLQTRKNTVLFSTARSKDRIEKFKWVGPLADTRIGFFARSGSAQVDTLEGMRKKRIGVQRNGIGHNFLKTKGFSNIDPATYPIANLKKLLHGRNDFWFSNNAAAYFYLNKLGQNSDDIELVHETLRMQTYIAFSKNTSDEVVDSWQRAFDQLVQKGVIRRIFDDHRLTILYPSEFGTKSPNLPR